VTIGTVPTRPTRRESYDKLTAAAQSRLDIATSPRHRSPRPFFTHLDPAAAVPIRPSLRCRSNLLASSLDRLFRRVALPALAVSIGLLGQPQPLQAQMFVPHTADLDAEQLERIGLELIEDADRWARFQQFGEAVPRAELASQLLPDSAQVWAILGSLYAQVDRLDEGMDALLKARAIEPENAAIRFTLGSAYFQGADYENAIAELQAGLELMPNTPGALFDLGNAYFMIEEFDRAIDSYEDAFEQNEEFWPALNNIGLVRYEQGLVDRAIGQWETSTTIAPQEAEPLLARATALYARGDREVGLSLAEEAIALDARYTDLEFLKINLWGERLLADVEQLLADPRLQIPIARTEPQAPTFIRP